MREHSLIARRTRAARQSGAVVPDGRSLVDAVTANGRFEPANGFFNMDIMISDGKCHIIEIGARTGATCIPEVISGHYGIDYYELMIHHALGQPLAVPQTPRQSCVGELLMSEKSGFLKQIEMGYAGNALASHISFDYRPGESVRRFHVGPDRIGQILVCGNTLSEVHEKLALARQEIQLVIE